MSQYIRKYAPGGAVYRPAEEIKKELNEHDYLADVDQTPVEESLPAGATKPTQTTEATTDTESTTPASKGKFTYQGRTFDVTDDFVNAWGKYVNSGNDDERNARSIILRALQEIQQNGGNLNFDGSGNLNGSDNVMQSIGSNFTESQRNALQKQRSGLSKWFTANVTPGSVTESFRRGIQGSRGFAYIAPTGDNSANTGLKDLGWDTIKLEFDENGKLRSNAASTLQAGERLNLAIGALGGGKSFDDWAKGYSGGTDGYKAAFMFRDQNEGWQARIQDAMNNVRNGNATDDDRDILRLIGIDGSLSSEAKAAIDAKTKADKLDADWSGRTINGITWNKENRDKYGDIFTFGENGEIYANDAYNWAGISSNANMDFNDLFNSNVAGYDERLRGFTKIGNRIYARADAGDASSDLYKFLNTANGYKSKQSSLDYAGANALMEGLWGQDPSNQWNRNTGEYYSNIFTGKSNLGFRKVNGNYDGMLPAGYQLMEYVDTNSTDTDAFGNQKVKYLVTDQYGNVVKNDQYGHMNEDGSWSARSFNDASELGLTLKDAGARSTDPQIFNMNRMVNNINDPRHGWVVVKGGIQNDGGPIQGTTVYEKPNKDPNGLNHIIHFDSPTMKKDFAVPDELYNLMEKYDLLDKVEKDADMKARWEKTWKVLTMNGFRAYVESNGNVAGDRKGFGNPYRNVLSRGDLEKMGFSKEDIKKFRGEFKKLNDLSKWEFNSNYTFNPLYNNQEAQIPSQKNGGIIKGAEGLLAQFGNAGQLGVAANVTKTQDHLGDYRKLSTLTGKKADWSHFTDADWAQLAALGLEGGALITTLVDPTNIGGAIAGVGGSLASYKADRLAGRSGLGTLAANLGFDAVTLLPIVGDAARIGRFTKAITKALPVITKAMGVVGMGNAAKTIREKIARGEGLNLADVRAIVGGIAGATALKRQGGFGRKKVNETVGKEAKFAAKENSQELTFKGADGTEHKFTIGADEAAKLKAARTQDEAAEIVLKAIQKNEPTFKKGDVNDAYWTKAIADAKGVKQYGEFTLTPEKSLEISKLEGGVKAQKDALIKHIASETGIAEADVPKIYDISKTIKEGRGISNGEKTGWKVWKKLQKPERSKTNLTETRPTEINPLEHSGLYNWWHGVGTTNVGLGKNRVHYNRATNEMSIRGIKRVNDYSGIPNEPGLLKTEGVLVPTKEVYGRLVTGNTPILGPHAAWNTSAAPALKPQNLTGYEITEEMAAPSAVYQPIATVGIYKKGGIVKASGGLNFNTIVGKKQNWDFSLPLEAIDYAHSLKTNNKMNELQHKTRPAQLQSFQLNTPRYQNLGLIDAAQSKAILEKPMVDTADSKVNAAIASNKYMSDSANEQNARAQESQNYAKYLESVNAINNQNKQNEVQTVNQNTQNLVQHNNAMIQSDINTAYGNWQSTRGALSYLKNQNAQMAAGNKAAQQYDKYVNRMNAINTAKQEDLAIKRWTDMYSAASAANDFDSEKYIKANQNAYDEFTTAMSGYNTQLAGLQNLYKLGKLKSGGKISSETKSYHATRKPHGEIQAEEQLKQVYKLIQQSNAAILKTLLK